MDTTRRLFSGLFVLLLASCGGGGGEPEAQPRPAASTVVLSASGAASQAQLRYAVDTGAAVDVSATLPWSVRLTLAPGQTLSATATRVGNGGDVNLQVLRSSGGSTVTGSGTTSATVRYTCCD